MTSSEAFSAKDGRPLATVHSLYPYGPDEIDMIPITRSAPGSDIDDPELDGIRFQQGFADAADELAALPAVWARHHASSTLDRGVPDGSDPSYARGYRAGMYGHLRHARR